MAHPADHLTHRPHLLSPRAHLSSRRGALAGAAWGLASMLPMAFPHTYFGLFGYPLARMLRWLLPSWYAVLALAPASSVTTAMPPWLFATVLALLSAALGAVIVLLARWAVARVSEARATVGT